MATFFMKILSLFDGIGCGRVALDRAGIPVDAYYASEIEDGSMKIATSAYPDIIEIGNVMNVGFDRTTGILHTDAGDFNVGEFDMVIGGSPCTDFSSIGYAKGMTTGQTEILSLDQYLELKGQGVSFSGQSYLFWEYLRILHEVQPKYFLLENVVMAKRWQKIINEAIGHSPIMINSSLLSAQNRPRLYWTNIDVNMPSDAGITLSSVLDPTAPTDDVSDCQTVQRSFDRMIKKIGYIPEKFNPYNDKEIHDKACALSRGSMVTSSCATLLFVPVADGVHIVDNGMMDGKYPTKLSDGRYNLRKLSITEMERLQTLPDNYTNFVGVGKQKRSAAIGNGWTVDVIAHILKGVPKQVV
jgi:DNA (cytosine-5)-methyltransferase 3A